VATATLVPTAPTNLDPAAQAEILALIQENMDAANDKDLERYMATIHPQSSFYASTRTALAQFFKMDLEIKYDVPSLEVTSITDTEARVNFVLKTVKISGSQEFRNNQVTGVWILRKDQGKWKIYGQEVTNIEYLK
jgi:ketosteroid isomerase-like protein